MSQNNAGSGCDPLTGLIDRREFERRLQRSVTNMSDRSFGHCLMHLNLDDLQSVCDSFGRTAADQGIRQVAEMLSREFDDVDIVARIGEDEFGVLVRDCPVDRGWAIGQEIRRSISAMSIVIDRPIKLTVSIGVARLTGTETIESALAAAKIACIIAKDRGRDRVVLYQHDNAVQLHSDARLHGVKNIQQALRDDRFLLYCQPIESLTAGSANRNFEILIRGIGDDGDPVLPGEFLPHAEHGRLMPSIDRWVVTHSLECLADCHHALGRTSGHFAINLSGQSLCDDGFLEFVVEEMSRTAIPAGLVGFEVTETAAILNVSRAKRFMSVLRERGACFALDDFGSGLSSFSYLKALPIDFLKIDGQFVREIAEDPVSNAIVAAINQMSHAMGLKTVAEWVEDTAIRTQLAGIGVDFAQGFGVAKPRRLETQLEELTKVRPLRAPGASG